MGNFSLWWETLQTLSQKLPLAYPYNPIFWPKTPFLGYKNTPKQRYAKKTQNKFFSELQKLEVRICVQPNFPIIILILLHGFHKFHRSRGLNSSGFQIVRVPLYEFRVFLTKFIFFSAKRENGKLVYCLVGILGSMWWFIVWHASVQALQLWCKSRPGWPEDHIACQVEIEKDLWIASPQWTSSEPKWFSAKCAFEFEETCPTEPDQTLVVSSP